MRQCAICAPVEPELTHPFHCVSGSPVPRLFNPVMVRTGVVNHLTRGGDINKPLGSTASNVSLSRVREGSSFVGLKTSQHGALFAGPLTPTQWSSPYSLLPFNSANGKAGSIPQEDSERDSARGSPLEGSCLSELQHSPSPFVSSIRRMPSSEYSNSSVLHGASTDEVEESRLGRTLPAWMVNNSIRPQERMTSSSWTPNAEQRGFHAGRDTETESVVSKEANIDHQPLHSSLDRLHKENWPVNNEISEEAEPEAGQPQFFVFL
jgi:hypothetical protein